MIRRFKKMSKRPYIILALLILFCYGYQYISDDLQNQVLQQQLTGPLNYDHVKLIALVKERYLIPPSSAAYNLDEDKNSPIKLPYYISYNYLKKILKILFDNKPPGFFVEAGAMDGEYISNSLYLEKHLGWNGLLVEPDGDTFKSLLGKHRKSWSSNTCLAAKPYPYKSSLLKVNIIGEDFSKRRAMGYKGFNALVETREANARMDKGYVTYEPVQCIPLPTLLLALGSTSVQLISLDIEDLEMEVLMNFPFDVITVDVWMVEHRHPSTKLTELDKLDLNFINWFSARNYSLLGCSTSHPMDYVFVRQQSMFYHEQMTTNLPLELQCKGL